jgi:hypothetical protein
LETGTIANTAAVSLLDAILLAYSAWNDVTQLTIANCFRKFGFVLGDATSFDADTFPLAYIDKQFKPPYTWEPTNYCHQKNKNNKKNNKTVDFASVLSHIQVF